MRKYSVFTIDELPVLVDVQLLERFFELLALVFNGCFEVFVLPGLHFLLQILVVAFNELQQSLNGLSTEPAWRHNNLLSLFTPTVLY